MIPYGHIKLTIEGLLVQMAKDLSDCRVVILRIGEVYGSESRLLRELATRLKRGFCPCPGSGHVAVSFVHAYDRTFKPVEDVALAFLCALERAPSGVSIYNVADDEPTTWRSFVRHLGDLLGTPPPVFLPHPLASVYMVGHQLISRMARREPVLTRHALRLLNTPKALANQKIKRELAFTPRFANFRRGLEVTVHGLPNHA